MAEISVIVPVYNVEKYISKCIESILVQTFEDFELILVDDGSMDRSGQICDIYEKKDVRIRVIHQKNQGQAAARNCGIELAKGRWVHFVDSDDIIHPQMLEILYVMLKKNNVRISMCGAIENDKVPMDFYKAVVTETKCYDVNEEYLNELFSKVSYRYWIVWGKLIDIEIVKKIPFTSGRVYEDNAIVCQWIYEAQKVADTNSELYFYRVNLSGTTKSPLSRKKMDFLWALEEQMLFYDRICYSEMLSEIWKYYLANATYMYKRFIDELNDIEAAKCIRIKIRKIYCRYRKKIIFEKNKYIYVMETFFPRLMKIYWYFVVLKNKICRFIYKFTLNLK